MSGKKKRCVHSALGDAEKSKSEKGENFYLEGQVNKIPGDKGSKQ